MLFCTKFPTRREAAMINKDFLKELASKSPTPGGGGASAYCGALASALASMVGNLTVGKKGYVEVEHEMEEALGRLSVIREALIDLIDADADAFIPLTEAWRMPHETAEQQAQREEATQIALIGACEPPLEIMKLCTEVIDICSFMAEKGNRIAVSDAGVGAVLAKSALLGASLNVRINCKSMADREHAQRYLTDVDACIDKYAKKADGVFAVVVEAVS